MFAVVLALPLFSLGAEKAEEDNVQNKTQQNMRIQVKVVHPKDGEEKKVIPRIDEEAAATIKATNENTLKEEKNIYSQNFWAFLFGAYVLLLIFNLSFDFEKKRKLQWFLEAFLTFLTIFIWDQLDFGRNNSWFPAVILESGIIIYAFYYYFFEKFKSNRS